MYKYDTCTNDTTIIMTQHVQIWGYTLQEKVKWNNLKKIKSYKCSIIL